jgi:hypothetical protein
MLTALPTESNKATIKTTSESPPEDSGDDARLTARRAHILRCPGRMLTAFPNEKGRVEAKAVTNEMQLWAWTIEKSPVSASTWREGLGLRQKPQFDTRPEIAVVSVARQCTESAMR